MEEELKEYYKKLVTNLIKENRNIELKDFKQNDVTFTYDIFNLTVYYSKKYTTYSLTVDYDEEKITKNIFGVTKTTTKLSDFGKMMIKYSEDTNTRMILSSLPEKEQEKILRKIKLKRILK
jgi:hypothetical protein